MMVGALDGRNRPPWLLRFRSSTAFIIATVWTSSFTDYFLYAMIVPVMPTALVDRANVPYEDREFWNSVLLMAEGGVALICCPIFGYLIDISPNRQTPYLLGLIFLGASMTLLSTGHNVGIFVAARLLQGGATSMVAVAGLALLTDSVNFDNLGQTVGYLGSAIALGFLLGPILGGIVYQAAGYQAVFGMAFAIIGVDFLMRVAVIEKKVASKWLTDDEETSHTNGNAAPQPQTEYQTFADPAPPADSSSLKKHPSSLLTIARQPRVLISSWALLVHGIFYSAFDATVPIFVESKFGWSPFGAGMTFLPSAITALFEPYFGAMSDRYGARMMTTAGFFLLAPPIIALRFVENNTLEHQVLLMALLTLIGLWINACVPALFVETQQVLEEMERATPGIFGAKGAVAQAFGIQTMSQFTGLFLGPLWGGFVEYRFGWSTMSLTLGILAGVTAIPMLWLSGPPAGEGDSEAERERLLPANGEARG